VLLSQNRSSPSDGMGVVVAGVRKIWPSQKGAADRAASKVNVVAGSPTELA